MSTERCPGCRARLQDSPVCPRCGCDLALVRRAETQACSLMRRALHAWTNGDHDQARACAAEARAIDGGLMAQMIQKFVTQ